MHIRVFLYGIVSYVSFSNAGGNAVSAKANDYGFDFVMKELIKQRADIEKQQAELERYRVELAEQKSLLEIQKSEIEKQKQSGGVSYIRWGRSNCLEHSLLVYKGHVAGGHCTRGGGGSNFLCLHDKPQYKKVIPGVAEYTGAIYGAEYELYGPNYVFSNANHGGRSLHNFPAPCAGCYAAARSTVMMIPARTQCPGKWTKEYQGYVVSALTHDKYTRRRSSYICIDEAPESATGGTNQNGALLYPIHVMCGSLPCSRFISGWELTCVVCTK